MDNDKFSSFTDDLKKFIDDSNIFLDKANLISYSYDASLETEIPSLAVIPENVKDVQKIVLLCNKYDIPFVARGAGTSYSGGPIPKRNAIVIDLLRLNKILKIDKLNKFAVLEPGVIIEDLNIALNEYDMKYAPDPASSQTCTIGGNIAANAGGPHCLGYGVTTHHLLSIKFILPDGKLVQLGSNTIDYCGPNLSNFFCGTEGTLGIIVEATVKIVKNREVHRSLKVQFETIEDCAKAVSSLIENSVKLTAIEMMIAPVVRDEEKSLKVNPPILMIDIESRESEVDTILDHLKNTCKIHNANNFEEFHINFSSMRDKIIRGRMKDLVNLTNKPRYFLVDAVVPRKNLYLLLPKINELSRKYNFSMRNNFHAGDGNIHPALFFDPRDEEEFKSLKIVLDEIRDECIKLGGSLTGEHGIGLEKKDYLPRVFSKEKIDYHKKIKHHFDKKELCNPEKMFPE